MDATKMTALLAALAETARANAREAGTVTDSDGCCAYDSPEREAWDRFAGVIEDALAEDAEPEPAPEPELVPRREAHAVCVTYGRHVISAGHNRRDCYLTVGD